MDQVWFVVEFVLLFALVPSVVGRLSGWQTLSEVYPATGPLPKTAFWPMNSILNMALSHCVNIAIDSKGMYFQMWIFFRAGSRSIFVPWTDISISEASVWQYSSTKLSFKRCEVSVHVEPWLADQMRKVAGPLWPQPVSAA